MSKLTQERLMQVLRFDEDLGRFFWTSPTARSVKVGAMAGRKTQDGYRMIWIDGFKVLEHRLVWLLMNGALPDGEIDHINHIRDDNKPLNLRVVSTSQNNKNKSIGKNNTSGIVGVCWNKQGKNWKAAITIDSKRIHLGYFKHIENAIEVRKAAELHYKFHENHGKKS